MFRKIVDRLSRGEQSKSRKQKHRRKARAAFQRDVGRQLQVEPLEDRRLLATFTNIAPT